MFLKRINNFEQAARGLLNSIRRWKMEVNYELVYYYIPTDEIFMSSYVTAHFYNLMSGIKWDDVLILGKLA